MDIKIDNSTDSAINGKWSKPSASFYDKLKHSKELLNEAFLIVGEKAGENCSFSNSGCKYPHHVIQGDKLVLSISGVKAAYQRAKQMGQFKGDVKSHLERHYKSLGIYEGSKMEADKNINENFLFIENTLGMPYLEGDPEVMLHMYGDTPRDLMKWMYHNIEYDDDYTNWEFRSSDKLILDGKGNCHDQAAFAEEMLRYMGYNTGRVFFIEYDESTGKCYKTHTLAWYGEENSIMLYWFENAWNTQYGIHGPYNGIENLMIEVEKIWIKENPDKTTKIYFSTSGNPEPGMNLGEYISSWRQTKSINEQFEDLYEFINSEYIEESRKLSQIGGGVILLTSTGFDNPNVKSVFMKYRNKIKNPKVLFIPTAANDKESREVLQLCIAEIAGCNIKAEQITWYNLDGSIPYKELCKYNIIYVAGGSEIKLSEAAIKDDFGKVIFTILKNNGIYVGVSAGSMILSDLGFEINKLEPHQNRKHSKNGSLPPITEIINISDNQAVYITKSDQIIIEAAEEYLTEAGRSTLLKKDKIHDYDKTLRYLIDSLPKQDKDYIGNGYWITSDKVLYRRIIKLDGEIVGFIDVYHKFPKLGNQGVVILAIDKYHRGSGFGKRLAKRMVVDFKKGKIDVDNLRWLVDKDNEASIKLAKSIGFKKTANLEKEYEYKLFKDKDIKESGNIINYSFLEETDDENDELEDRSTCEFIPVFVIGKSYSWSELNNDGTPKSQDEIGSIGFSKVMKKYAKGDNYSHALISFNSDLTNMYSFEHNGFVKESILTKESWKGTKSIYIAAIFVTKNEFNSIKKAIHEFDDNKESTTYAYGNFLRALFAKKMTKIKERQFCSSFVGYLLNMANPKNIHRDYSRLRPEDITILPRSYFIANPKDRDDLIKHLPEIKKKVKDIWKEHEKEIREYNNEIPKFQLKQATDEMDRTDKIFDWMVNKVLGSGTH